MESGATCSASPRYEAQAASARSCGAARHPLVDHLVKHCQRHRCGGEPSIMEVADVELAAEAALGLGPQFQPARLPHFVAGRLARPGAIALDFGGHTCPVLSRSRS